MDHPTHPVDSAAVAISAVARLMVEQAEEQLAADQ